MMVPKTVAYSALIEKELTLHERVELWSRVGAGILALTYVSGYLIATSHLGSFGIPSDTSEFLKAKYIYIGFLYWMFVAVVIVVARGLASLLGVMKINEPVSDEEMKFVRSRLGSSDAAPSQNAGQNLRKWIVLSLILLVFSFEILFLNPNDLRAYIPLQSILLLSFSLYQTTFYREYSQDSYKWGLVHGKYYVQQVRWICGIVPGIIAAILMFGIAMIPYVFEDYNISSIMWFLIHIVRPSYEKVTLIQHSKFFWFFGWILILFLSYVSLFVTLSSDNLKWLEKNGMANRPNRLWLFKIILLPIDLLLLIIYAARIFFLDLLHLIKYVSAKYLSKILFKRAQERSVDSNDKGKHKWLSAIDCFFLPLFSGLYTWLALKTLKGDNSCFRAGLLGFGNLVLSLLVLSNLIIILGLRSDLLNHLGVPEPRTDHNTGLLGNFNTWAVRILMFAILYIVSVFGFAHRIYPFIPVEKAGGNYSTAKPVYIHLAENTDACSSRDLKNSILSTSKYIILEEDANWIYVAPLYGDGNGDGPDCWKWGIFCHDQPKGSSPAQKKTYRPKVYAINRHCIAGMEATDTSGKE